MVCIICQAASKYKCPVCQEPYCSVDCYKKHKEVPCKACSPPPQVEEDKTNISDKTFDFPTEDTVPTNKLELLADSTDVKKCLENPHVRKILQLLDNSPHPDQLMEDYMQEPIFTEFVDACLKVVEPHKTET